MRLFVIVFFVFLFPASAYCSSVDSAHYSLVVDRNGRGDYRTIQEAINTVRAFIPDSIVTIFIHAGTYKEKLVIPSYVAHVRLIGEDETNTIITYDDHANINKMGTFNTHSVLIQGNDITLENLTISNTALPLGQAVALHIEGDRIVVKNCKILGRQDTYYGGKEGARQYFENCYIEGTTDFIFGPSTCWFEKCTIYCKQNSYITAGSTPKQVAFGFVFNHCKIVLADSVHAVFLGRPWRAYAMTLFMNSDLPKGILPQGWSNWKNTEYNKTARYLEYNNSGLGAKTSNRAPWIHILSSKDASNYTLHNVFGLWNPLEDMKKE